MIEIIMESNSGLKNCFGLKFRFADFLPPNIESAEMWSCYKYFTWLFNQHGLVVGNSDVKKYIYTIHWDCQIDGIPFSMVYDEDNDWMSFSVSEKNIEDIPHIAEEIKKLIYL